MNDLPYSLARAPQLDTWFDFSGGGVVIVHTGKVELGQGITTAIAAIAAFELDVDPTQVLVVTGNTLTGPNEGITAGSMSIQMSGAAVRQACAEVRRVACERAGTLLNLDPNLITVSGGVLVAGESAPNPAPASPIEDDQRGHNERTITYWDLFADGIKADATGLANPRKPVPATSPISRVDLPAKMSGKPVFIQDAPARDPLQQVLHARVVRHHNPGAVLASIDITATQALSGVVAVVRDGQFLAVAATDEATAVAAKAALEVAATWALPASTNTDTMVHLTTNLLDSLLLDGGTPCDAPVPPVAATSAGEQSLTARYYKPYHLHGAIAPSAARATWDGQHLSVVSHSQGPHILRGALANALSMDASAIDVTHEPNAGCYGHNGADDAAMDAALVALALPGQQILLKWTREDEHLWEPMSPATVIDVQAHFQGRINYWSADVYSETHSGRPGPTPGASTLIAAGERLIPLPRPAIKPGRGPHSGIHRNADPMYTFERRRVVKHLAAPVCRTSSTRGLGAFANVFAIESFMDEVAHASGANPVEFRLAHLDDPRASTVVKQCADAASLWRAEAGEHPTGTGFAFARYKNAQTYCCVAIQVAVDPETAQVKLLRAHIAADAGRIVDADGLAHQLEGGLVQSASWALKEAVRFDAGGRASDNWDTYPILTFSEVPQVTCSLTDQPDLPSLGAGEASTGPTPAAIGNAIFAATGIRCRTLPFSPENLRSAAGSG